MNNVEDLMFQLWYGEKQRKIFLCAYQYGPKPASTIAQLTKTERSYTYKVLQEFVDEHLIRQSVIKWVKHFYVPGSDTLLQAIKQRQEKLSSMEEDYPKVRQQLEQLDTEKIPYVPKMNMYEWPEGIAQWYENMKQYIVQEKILVIKFFGSDIFPSQVDRFQVPEKQYHTFLEFLDQQDIAIQSYIGEWRLTVENIQHTLSVDYLKQLPVGNQSAQLRVVWSIVYMWLFREYPIGLKIQSPDMADMMHVILEHVGK